MSSFKIGYYTGSRGRRSGVHIVKPNGKIACNYRQLTQYHNVASGLHMEYVTCPGCKAWAERHGIK